LLLCFCFCVNPAPTRHTWLLKRKDNSFPGSPPTSPSSIVLPLSFAVGVVKRRTAQFFHVLAQECEPDSLSTDLVRRCICCLCSVFVCCCCQQPTNCHTVTRWSHSVCQTEFPYVLGPADPCPTAVDMEAFSSSVLKVFILIFAATTKICTGGCFTWSYDRRGCVTRVDLRPPPRPPRRENGMRKNANPSK